MERSKPGSSLGFSSSETDDLNGASVSCIGWAQPHRCHETQKPASAGFCFLALRLYAGSAKCCIPSPLQSGQTISWMVPSPAQSWHCALSWDRSAPVPPQLGHRTSTSPPRPWHLRQTAVLGIGLLKGVLCHAREVLYFKTRELECGHGPADLKIAQHITKSSNFHVTLGERKTIWVLTQRL